MLCTHLQAEEAVAAAVAPRTATRYVTRYALKSDVVVMWSGNVKHRTFQSKTRGHFHQAKVCFLCKIVAQLTLAMVLRVWFVY